MAMMGRGTVERKKNQEVTFKDGSSNEVKGGVFAGRVTCGHIPFYLLSY